MRAPNIVTHKRNRDRTREALLERLRQLKLAREAFDTAQGKLTYDSTEWKAQNEFNEGFDWAMEKIKEIA
jgi:hypothetical protein